MRQYLEVLRTPGAARMCASGFAARFPSCMIGIAITLMISGLYGEYQLAGLITAVSVLCNAICAPLVGRLIDRYGQRRMGRLLLTGFCLSCAASVVAAELRVSPTILVVFALTAGMSTFPVGALTRSRWAYLLKERPGLQSAFSLESILDDIGFIVAPTVATVLATAHLPGLGVQPAAAMTLCVVLFAVAGALFLGHKVSEPPVLAPKDRSRSRSAITVPGVALISVVFVGVGVQFGANSITLVAMCESLGAKWAAGPIGACGSVASMAGALYYGARGWRSPLWKRFVFGLCLVGGSALLFLTAWQFWSLSLVSFLAGVAISPTFINGNSLIQQIVPPENLTEGLTWIGTALGVGIAAGSALAGRMVDTYGAHSGYWVLAAGATLAMAIALISAPILRRHSTKTATVNSETRN